MTGALDRLLTRVGQPEKQRLRGAVACAALLGVATVALLGVSGWFIAAAAGAGGAGVVAAGAFNYMLPSAAIRLGTIARTGARYGDRLLGHQAALLTLARVRPLLFAALTRMAPARALKVAAGQAAAVLVQDAQAIEMRLAQRTAAWGAAAAASAGVGLAAVAGWAPALSTALLAIALGLAGRALAIRSTTTAVGVRQATGQLKDQLAFLAAAQVELRCHALEGWATDTIAGASAALDAAQRRHAAVLGAFDVLQSSATGLAATAGIWLALPAGAPLAALAGLSAAMAIEGMAPWLRALAHRGAAGEAARRLDDLLDAPESAAADEAASPWRSPSIALSAFGGVCLREGERVAIVGPSGCGKTTLVETLVGLRACAKGVVTIAGQDIAEGSVAAQRACFAWLPQDCALIAGTVRDNLRLARDDVDELTMWRVLRDAALADRVRTLAQGLDTWLGTDGARLSGGERRRLALARAYLSDAPWLLLDEPTVGLDPVTEEAVLDALEARLADTGQGLIVVTHRAALVARCDRTLSFVVPQPQADSLASLAA